MRVRMSVIGRMALLGWLALGPMQARVSTAEEPLASRGAGVEAPDVAQKIGELVNRAREIYGRRDQLVEQRRPLEVEREQLATRIEKLVMLQKEGTVTLKTMNRQAQQMSDTIQNANAQGADTFSMRLEFDGLQRDIARHQRTMKANETAIDVGSRDLKTIDGQIGPIDKDLARLWSDLEDIRRQWVDVRQPSEKFAHGDYEGLSQAIDGWHQVDGLWLAGFYWKALCASELGDVAEAEGHINKAEDIRTKELGQTDPVADAEAVLGLVHTKMGGKYAIRAKDRLAKAGRLNTKRPSWFVNFVIGRCYLDREADAARAKTEFEKSLKAQPDNPCARVWLARLQTTTKKDGVRDVAAGTKVLEAMWTDSGKQSMRLGQFLADAYEAAGRKEDAESLRKTLRAG